MARPGEEAWGLCRYRGGNNLGFRLRLLAVLALGTVVGSTPTPAGAAGSDISVLASQRQALQSQAAELQGSRDSTVTALLETQDRIAGMRRQIARNASVLADLQRQQEDLTAAIATLQEEVGTDTATLAGIAREQYKSKDQTNIWQVLFSSDNLGQAINRVVAAQSMSDRAHMLVLRLRDRQRSLDEQRRTLSVTQADTEQTQRQLIAGKSQLIAVAADYQAKVDAIDASAHDLLAHIQQVNSAIAAASSPPPGGSSASQQQVITIIRAAAARYGVDGDKMVRVARCESGLNPKAYDPASGASGLFQFMPGTFYGNGGHDIWDAADQSDVAARMFSRGQGGSWACQ